MPISRGSTPQLETVLIEMIVQAADFPAASFDTVAGDCADKSGGRILFNVRVDSHVDVQRVAAIASKSDEGDDSFAFAVGSYGDVDQE
ncbi:hypothetical protein [Mesorhizobium sp. M0207]|uniref:hypothetical protein n=1 Tax=Mesorhizobium sp. M0207 TaxID=2956915 RepID=UPI0033391AC3